MTEKRYASRLCILADKNAAGDAGFSWVEIRLTDAFLDRVLELHTVLIQYQLENVTALVEAHWDLEDKWAVEDYGLNSGCLMHVFESGLAVECPAVSKIDSGLMLRCHDFKATYIWGQISELVEDRRPSTDFPVAYFEKLGLFESDEEYGAFRNAVLNGS